MGFLLVGVGGFLGSVARYGVTLAFRGGGAFPYAILLVNVLGCAALGYVFRLAARPEGVSAPFLLLAATGFLGGFTTFSAFGWDTLQLFQSGREGLALLNVGANVGLGLLAIWVFL